MQWSQVNNMTYGKMLTMFKRKEINFNHAVQRREVWDDVRHSDFIYSMIMGYPTISFLSELRTEGHAKNGIHYILDGKQRLTTVFKFMTDKFPLYNGNSAKKLARKIGDFELEGKKYSDLPKEMQEAIHTYNPAVLQIINATEQEVKEIFYFINSRGISLTPWEVTMSQLDSQLKTFTAELQELPIWGKVAITEKEQNRFKFDEIITQVASLIEGYVMNFSGVDLRKYALLLNGKFSDTLKTGTRNVFEYASKIDFSDGEAKMMLKKVNLPIVIYACKFAIEHNVPPEVFHDILVKAYTALPDNYTNSVKSNTNKIASVKIRYTYLENFVQNAIKEWEENAKGSDMFKEPEAVKEETTLPDVAATNTDSEVANNEQQQQEQQPA